MGIMGQPGYHYVQCMDIIYDICDTVGITSSFNTSNKNLIDVSIHGIGQFYRIIYMYPWTFCEYLFHELLGINSKVFFFFFLFTTGRFYCKKNSTVRYIR